MRVFLGIDTSSYTSSMCLVGEDGSVIADERIVLHVASGSRGLRQSEALFQHVKNLPQLSSVLQPVLAKHTLAALGVSVQPRPQDDSYMPVFLPGWGLAKSTASFLNVPCHELSHQETHIWSGIASAPGPASQEFLAIHLSGGTTELAHVQRDKRSYRLSIDLWGGTLISRRPICRSHRVQLGLPFQPVRLGATGPEKCRGAAIPIFIAQAW